MAETDVLYCLAIENPSAVTPFDLADPTGNDEHFWVTSSRDPDLHNYITAPPDDYGDTLDLLTSKVTDGACRVAVSDVYQGGGIVGTPPSISDTLTGDITQSGWVAQSSAGLGGSSATGSIGPDGDISQNLACNLLGGVGPVYAQMYKTFFAADGVAPNTTYAVRVICRAKPRTSPDRLTPGNGAKPRLQVWTESGPTEAYGIEYDASGADPYEPWGVLSVTVTTGSIGYLGIGWGWYSLTGAWLFTGFEFDSVTITEVQSPGLPAGRYVTLWLADTSARQQMLGRAAYVLESIDGGATWTILRHGYVTDIELPVAQTYLITVGGARRRERTTMVGRLHTIVQGGLVDGYSTDKGYREAAILGGPIAAGGMPGFGVGAFPLPPFTVRATQANSSAGAGDGWVAVEYAGPTFGLPPFQLPRSYKGRQTQGFASISDVLATVNAMARPFFVDAAPQIANPSAPYGPVFLRGSYPGIAIYAFAYDTDDYVGGALTAYGTTQLNIPAGEVVEGFITAVGAGQGTIFLRWGLDDPDAVVPVGTVVRLLAVPVPMSSRFPAYLLAHPVNIVLGILLSLGLAVDSASVTTAIAALGDGLICALELSDPNRNIQDLIEELGAVFGFATVLADDSTARKIVVTSDKPATTAATFTTDNAQMLAGPIYRASESDRRNMVRIDARQFAKWVSGMDEDRPYSDLVGFDIPFEFPYLSDGIDPDADTYGEQAIDLRLSGTVATVQPGATLSDANPVTPLNLFDFMEARAARLFDRHGRGAPIYTIRTVGRSGVSLGQVITVDLPHLPNAQPGRDPASQRSGPRPMRVVGIGRKPSGDMLTCVDEGNGIPLSQSFTITGIAALADDAGAYNYLDPNSTQQAFCVVSLSGLAALAAVNGQINLYVSYTDVGDATAPSDTGVLVKTVDSRHYGGDTADVIIGPLPLRSLVTWWVRGVAWADGYGFSASTFWYSENGPDTSGTPIDPNTGDPGTTPPPTSPPTLSGDLSGLTFDVTETHYVDLSWTNTDTATPVRVRFRVDGTDPWSTLGTFQPGTTQARLTPLAADTTYNVEVTMVTIVGQQPIGTLLEDDVTTLTTGVGNPITLSTPTLPRAYSGFDPTLGVQPGMVGMMVRLQSVPYPHFILFEMATETAAGSGVPGPWPSDQQMATNKQQTKTAAPGDVSASFLCPYDTLVRYFRAKAIDPTGNYTDSAWTSVVEATPFTYKPLTAGNNLVEIAAVNVDGVGATGAETVSAPPTAMELAALAAAGRIGSISLTALNAITAFRFDANNSVRLRLYNSSAKRDADVARVIGDAYDPGDGLYFEVILPKNISGTDYFWLSPSPFPTFGPADGSGNVTIYYTIANLYPSGTTADLLVQMQYTAN